MNEQDKSYIIRRSFGFFFSFELDGRRLRNFGFDIFLGNGDCISSLYFVFSAVYSEYFIDSYIKFCGNAFDGFFTTFYLVIKNFRFGLRFCQFFVVGSDAYYFSYR